MTRGRIHLLDLCVGNGNARKELFTASLGCLMGSILVLLAIEAWAGSRAFQGREDDGDVFVTLNKQVEGGILINLAQNEKSFNDSEVSDIQKLPGVREVAGFTRNHFPVTVNIWPAGRIGLGSAARADLFFESIPDPFLDQVPDSWKWEENASFVPIMVPKFYLDLWNFGLAPSRNEYPALSLETASSMPIEIYIGENRSVRMQGRFVAFSKRINSVLVPEGFLKWANERFTNPSQEPYFFVWRKGQIEGVPVALSDLAESKISHSEGRQVSTIGKPAERMSVSEALAYNQTQDDPSRLIVKLDGSPSEDFFKGLEKLGCETNREFPQDDLIRKFVRPLIVGLLGFGVVLSLLSIATFTSGFRLLVIQSAEHARNLLHLGFGESEITAVFVRRFRRIFVTILALSLVSCYLIRVMIAQFAEGYGIALSKGLEWQTISGLILYGAGIFIINRRVIQESVKSCS